MRVPLNNIGEFKNIHQSMEDRIANYITHPKRKGMNWAWLRHLMDSKHIDAMYSGNMGSRIRFARIVLDHVPQMLDAAGEGEFFHVTICLKRYALPLSAAAGINLRSLHGFVHQALAGHNFVGMTEAAFYRNFGRRCRSEPTVSWHVHLLVWTLDPEGLKRLIQAINASEQSLVRGIKPAFCDPIEADEVEDKLCYITKATRDESVVYEVKKKIEDNLTGEIFVVATGRFRQKKEALQTGNLIKMLKVMEDHWLDRLIVGGGDGKAIMASIRQKALADFHRKEALRRR